MSERLYNPTALGLNRTFMTALAIFVAAFVSLYPYLGNAHSCDAGECPQAMQTHTASSSCPAAVCVAATLSASWVAALALTTFARRLYFSPRPFELRFAPESPPPQTSLA